MAIDEKSVRLLAINARDLKRLCDRMSVSIWKPCD